ncbi:coenzyme F420-0:L-glutamate ligase [Streptomyces sp. SM12]|uniref:coenzyme F420-0:L-glutamate ligase n=1 Tax=Streptomyces sp. SM12 TaxID=1071602 RepID=UPI000CD54AFA|nr:coenzyme F420-0:L-glutamate ligase [Streptomyces sp. SM12]
MTTTSFSAVGVEPFPDVRRGDNLAVAITEALAATGTALADGDVLVIASKAVSIAEDRYIPYTTVTPTAEAEDLAQRTGKPPALCQIILSESTDHYLASASGPIIARHRLGYELTSAGVDRDGDRGAWLLPADPDASARALRDAITRATGIPVAVVIADSDGRADRRGSTVIAIGAASIAPLRTTSSPTGKRQEETFTDLVAAAAGIILGQRGRGAPLAVLRGLNYTPSDTGVAAILHQQHESER